MSILLNDKLVSNRITLSCDGSCDPHRRPPHVLSPSSSILTRLPSARPWPPSLAVLVAEAAPCRTAPPSSFYDQRCPHDSPLPYLGTARSSTTVTLDPRPPHDPSCIRVFVSNIENLFMVVPTPNSFLLPLRARSINSHCD
jgi:hypothetical protein